MKLKLFVVATLIVLQTSAVVSAQQIDASQRSYQQARRVLDDAITAHGGVEALRAIKDFTLKEKGKVHARFQSPGAEGPIAVGTSEETLIVDTERGFVYDDLKTRMAVLTTGIELSSKAPKARILICGPELPHRLQMLP